MGRSCQPTAEPTVGEARNAVPTVQRDGEHCQPAGLPGRPLDPGAVLRRVEVEWNLRGRSAVIENICDGKEVTDAIHNQVLDLECVCGRSGRHQSHETRGRAAVVRTRSPR